MARLTSTRAKAQEEAAAELTALGFKDKEGEAGRWAELRPPAGAYKFEVSLPKAFPDELPEVYVADYKSIKEPLPHLEHTGKVCIAPSGGVLIDVTRPREVVKQAIEQARRAIEDAAKNTVNGDLQREFLAYWDSDEKDKFSMVGSLPAAEGEFLVLNAASGGLFQHLLAPTPEEAKAWAIRAGLTPKMTYKAYHLPLTKALIPPRFDDRWTTKQFFERLSAEGIDSDAALLWILEQPRLPLDLILSMPGTSGNIAVGVRFYPQIGPVKEATAGDYLKTHPDAPAKRLSVKRLDADFLLSRGGGIPPLIGKTVVLVGCGAVGSQVAKLLALLGVGALHLADPETLGEENIHRHLLGAGHIGRNKAAAIAMLLGRDYPHLKFIAHEKAALELFESNPALFTSADAVMFATGDETLELRFDALLVGGPPRVHAWVEPVGLGGHALAVGPGVGGCLHCLYPENVGTNVASFVQPGQMIRRSFAGCAGDFLPFSAVDAMRTATEAADLLARVLVAQEAQSVLISWHGDTAGAAGAKIELAQKVAQFSPGERRTLEDIRRLDCRNCSGTP